MSSTIVTKQCIRSFSVADDVDLSDLDDLIRKNWAKNSANRKAKLAEKESNSKKGASREPAIALGAVAWDNMFEDDTVKIPDTNFMN